MRDAVEQCNQCKMAMGRCKVYPLRPLRRYYSPKTV
jgi:hypothetical protein